MTVYVRGFRERSPEGCIDVNTTSRGNMPGLSPFFCGPVQLYRDHVAKNVENAWQFSKVYPQHVSKTGKILPAYWDWAFRGWADTYAHRYPAGKGAIPLFSLWDGERMDYVTARRNIYFPLYKKTVRYTSDWEKLKRLASEQDVCLIDFDARRIDLTGENLLQVMLEPNKKMGHAFILKMMLDHGEKVTFRQLQAIYK